MHAKTESLTRAPLTIEVCPKETSSDWQSQWNAYVAQHPAASFYHRYEWAKLNREQLGNECHFLVARREGRVAGILPLSLLASPWFGRILCSMPYVNYGGPCGDDAEVEDALTRKAVELTGQLNAKHLELRTKRPSGVEMPVSTRKVSLTLALNPDPEALWNGFASKHRTNIRRAQKNNLTVRDGGLELLDVFYSMMEQSWQHLGTPLYRKAYFKAILETFPNDTRIFVCEQGSEPIAVAFNGYGNGVVEGMWAGGGPRARELQANYVLYWEMMREACLRGSKLYHLGRSTADSGAEDFKKKWNAESQQLYWYFHRPDGGPMPELNVANPKFQLAIKVWRKLPLWVTRQVGPVLARSIP
jgi:FemAB-related protein (PEP-CTERM system-associated)